MRLPADPPQTVALIDSREQQPFRLPGLSTQLTTLTTGDYSVLGLESHVALERKSLPDFIGCVGSQRERFERELARLVAFPVRAVVCEFDAADLQRAEWRSKITPKQAIGSLIGWQVRGVPFVLAGSRELADQWTASMLRRVAIHRWRELRAMAGDIEPTEPLSP